MRNVREPIELGRLGIFSTLQTFVPVLAESDVFANASGRLSLMNVDDLSILGDPRPLVGYHIEQLGNAIIAIPQLKIQRLWCRLFAHSKVPPIGAWLWGYRSSRSMQARLASEIMRPLPILSNYSGPARTNGVRPPPQPGESELT
jgi:hypothetical protein